MAKKFKKKYLKKYKKEAQKERSEEPEKTSQSMHLKSETKNGIIVVCVFAVAVLFILSLFGWAGELGKAINTGLIYLFGWGKFAVPIILILVGYFLAQPQKYIFKTANFVGLILIMVGYSGILHLLAWPLDKAVSDLASGKGGGYFGLALSYPLQKIMGPWATAVVLLALMIVSLQIMFDVSLKRLYERGNIFKRIATRFREFSYRIKSNLESTTNANYDQKVTQEKTDFGVKEITSEAKAEPIAEKNEQKPDKEKQMEIFKKEKKVRRNIEVPIDLLELSHTKPTSGNIEANKEKIHSTLRNFGIDVEMGDVQVGPTVTQFTLRPTEGVKLSQIITLHNDLALALAAHPIRIEAPIPGKSLVGIEVPNQAVALVKLKEILASNEFKKRRSGLTVGLGKDVAGHPWLADLTNMPHMLVAGATGSGKSVCLNSIIISLLYQNSPDDLKLILIDPKKVEMPVYNGVPHLLTPVVTDVDKTINALRWVVSEMDRRFQLLSETKHRNIEVYNKENGDIMPYIVLVVDELADLMAVAANEVEAAVVRLAQMARAVGIHLVLATQRPSVDVITGLIKANITSRIAFSVASIVDSRTILDTSGAEKLLGRGDLLFISSDIAKPKRLQGAYVTDQEIERVTSFLKSKAKPEYQEEVTEKVIDKTLNGNFEDLEDDDLLPQAKEVVIRAGKGSASLLQRRLRVGYARAARLLDLMEEQGIIGPGDGAKPREVLVKKDEFGINAGFEEANDAQEDESMDIEDNNQEEDT